MYFVEFLLFLLFFCPLRPFIYHNFPPYSLFSPSPSYFPSHLLLLTSPSVPLSSILPIQFLLFLLFLPPTPYPPTHPILSSPYSSSHPLPPNTIPFRRAAQIPQREGAESSAPQPPSGMESHLRRSLPSQRGRQPCTKPPSVLRRGPPASSSSRHKDPVLAPTTSWLKTFRINKAS